MPYYGYVGGGIRNVFSDYSKVKRLVLIHPYSKYRRLETEAKAWEWVRQQHKIKAATSLVRYGNIFNKHYVKIEYFILEDVVCYNVRTSTLGYVKLASTDPDVRIENRTEVIKVAIKNLKLNDDLIISHLIAIYQILKILGTYVDVELVVPDHSIFYTLTKYNGSNMRLTRALANIRNRKGNFAITIKNY